MPPEPDKTYRKIMLPYMPKGTRPLALLFAPFLNRTPEVEALTDRAVRHLIALGWVPLYLPYALRGALDDTIPGQRDVALECSASVTAQLSALANAWAFDLGLPSEGVKLDREAWLAAGGPPIRQVTFTEADAPH